MKAAREGLSTLSRQLSQASANDGSVLLNRVYGTLFKTHRVPNSAAATKALMEQRAAVPIPPTLYRGQTVNGDANFLASKWGLSTKRHGMRILQLVFGTALEQEAARARYCR